MKTKERMRFELKGLTATEGTFEGLLSPYMNVDGGGEVVMPGAYTKTLQEQGGQVPMLWQHSVKDPIGTLTLEDRPDGLWCKGEFLMEDPLAARAYRFVKARIVKGLSIGFESVKDTVVEGVRRLHEIKLYEGSIVTFPLNESALIASVKAVGDLSDDIDLEFKAGAMLSAANITKLSTMREHMKSAHDILSALLDPEAGADEETTSEAKAADEKPEPVNHSEAAAQIEHMKGLFKWN